MDTRLHSIVSGSEEAEVPTDRLEHEAAARAAMSVCECLVITLIERGVIDRAEMRGTLEDARNSHAYATGSREDRRISQRAADLIGRLLGTVDAI